MRFCRQASRNGGTPNETSCVKDCRKISVLGSILRGGVKMRFAMVAAFVGILISSCGPVTAQSPEITKWLERNSMLDRWCRGDSGDLSTTDKACDLREVTSVELEKLGWCYGKNSEAGYQKRWHVCGADSQRLTVAPANPTPIAIASFEGVWGEVSDRCRSFRAKTEGPYLTIRERRFVPEGGSGNCRRPSYTINGNTLAVKTVCQIEDSGNEPVSASYTLVKDQLRSSQGQMYQRCAR